MGGKLTFRERAPSPSTGLSPFPTYLPLCCGQSGQEPVQSCIALTTAGAATAPALADSSTTAAISFFMFLSIERLNWSVSRGSRRWRIKRRINSGELLRKAAGHRDRRQNVNFDQWEGRQHRRASCAVASTHMRGPLVVAVVHHGNRDRGLQRAFRAGGAGRHKPKQPEHRL
jgi:hypothetical protein